MEGTTDLRITYQSALTNAGVPETLAAQCAEIVAKDNPSLPNLGRTQEEQQLINSAMEWMKAKGFFEQ